MTEQQLMERYAHQLALKDAEIAHKAGKIKLLEEIVEHLKGQIKSLTERQEKK